MQDFLKLAPAIAESDEFGSCVGAGQVGLNDTRDVGAVAAEIAASPAEHAGKTYSLTGPELLSYSDVAAVLSKVLGRSIMFKRARG